MKRYSDYNSVIADVEWTKFKIVVPTEEDKKEVMAAFKHCHDANIDTDFVTVNQLVHEYEHGDASDQYSNIIVDKDLYESICKSK